MTTLLVPTEAYKLKRGDVLVFPPRLMESRGKHRRNNPLEGTGEYEVCGTMLADGNVKVFCLDENLDNHMVMLNFDSEVNVLEWL